VALAIALGVIAVAWVLSTQARAERTLDGFGRLERVAVARRDLLPGHELTGGDVEWRRLPAIARPRRPVSDAVTGRTVLAPIGAGQVLADTQLSPRARRGLAALVPAGRVAIAIPVPDAHLAVRVGDVVDVLAASDDSRPVATAAIVVAVADRAVTVAVTPAQGDRLAVALGAGPPVLALHGVR
jgi:Flp pilus assembly protein CpaB